MRYHAYIEMYRQVNSGQQKNKCLNRRYVLNICLLLNLLCCIIMQCLKSILQTLLVSFVVLEQLTAFAAYSTDNLIKYEFLSS